MEASIVSDSKRAGFPGSSQCNAACDAVGASTAVNASLSRRNFDWQSFVHRWLHWIDSTNSISVTCLWLGVIVVIGQLRFSRGLPLVETVTKNSDGVLRGQCQNKRETITKSNEGEPDYIYIIIYIYVCGYKLQMDDFLK